MTKKLSAISIGLLSLFCAIGLSACSESCMNSCASWVFRPTPPTEQSVRENLSEYWAFDLPDNITIVNYAIDLGLSDGDYHYVFVYDGSDETFNTLLSPEKDEEFEKKFLISFNTVKEYFAKEYTLPDLNENYLWALKIKQSSSTSLYDFLFVLYFQSDRQLIIAKSLGYSKI